jgi:hypothetical protein
MSILDNYDIFINICEFLDAKNLFKLERLSKYHKIIICDLPVNFNKIKKNINIQYIYDKYGKQIMEKIVEKYKIKELGIIYIKYQDSPKSIRFDKCCSSSSYSCGNKSYDECCSSNSVNYSCGNKKYKSSSRSCSGDDKNNDECCSSNSFSYSCGNKKYKSGNDWCNKKNYKRC